VGKEPVRRKHENRDSTTGVNEMNQQATANGPYSAPIKELWSVSPKVLAELTDAQLEIATLREKLNYERRVNGILADKLAASEYDRNHYKSLLKKALEK
jgi:hypothetical protein